MFLISMTEDISGNISDPILKAIVTHRNHPSIKVIKRNSNSNNLFSFDIVDRVKNFKEIIPTSEYKSY